jgi:phage tail-like protein
VDLFDAIKVDEKYLPQLAYSLGTPIGIDNSPDTYRKILAHAVEIYKVKGTKDIIPIIIYYLIGVDINIIEELPKKGC